MSHARAHARAALAAVQHTGDDVDQIADLIVDLIADLLIDAEARGLDTADLLDRARGYADEANDDDKADPAPSYVLHLEFTDAEDLHRALAHIADSDAPVFLPNDSHSYVETGDHTGVDGRNRFPLWTDHVAALTLTKPADL